MPALQPANQTMSIHTMANRVFVAGDRILDVTSNGYIGIGMNQKWDANTDSNIVPPTNSIDYINNVRRNLVAVKKISISDAVVVVNRVDWIANTKYYAFSNTIDMYATSAVINANGQVTITNGNNQVIGSNTTFFLDYSNNSLITIPGDNVYVLPQTREIINVVSNTLIVVNNAFTANFTANVSKSTTNYYPNYAKNFYVRNSYDQVFICLSNNLNVASTIMPTISLGGQLPSNPYIITSDGYKWKYLYTISAGYKQKFFTSQWMPVIEDTTVELAAVDGRIDIINILNGGTGYNNTAASFNAPILNIIGDGTGANITAQVDANGTIYGVNVLNGGSEYTTAKVTANTGANGSNALFQVVIGPPGGWGSNAALELGASSVMFSVTLNDTENGTIPTDDFLGEFFTYRQISIFDSPIVSTTGLVANTINYDTTTVIQCATTVNFEMGDIAFQSNDATFANAVFTGTVVWFDDTNNELHLNNVNGVFSSNLTMNDANNSHVIVAVYTITPPLIDIFSGEINFIENRAPVTRSPGQTENIKIILQF